MMLGNHGRIPTREGAMSEYRVEIDKPVLLGGNGEQTIFFLNREQAQQVSDSLASQGVGVSLGRPDNRPSPSWPIAVQCPWYGGMRVELQWFAGEQVYITRCLDCERRRAKEEERVKGANESICTMCMHRGKDACVGSLKSRITINGRVTQCSGFKGR